MRIINRTFCLLALIATLASCEKEKSFDTSTLGQGGGGNATDIIGNWKFISGTAKTEVAITGKDLTGGTIKTVSLSEYTTENNTGTLKVEATKMTGNALGYSINSTVRGYFYEDNVLIDSIEAPFIAQMPPTNSVSNYRRVTSDSIYFEGGGSFMVVSTGSSTPSQASGAKIKFEGNKMMMTTSAVQNKTIDTLGARFNQFSKINVVMTWQRL